MANYQNGLYLADDSTYNNLYGGKVFCRWLYEWLTQVVGWTAHDENVSNWTDVEASGLAGTQGVTTADAARVDMSASGRSWTAADKDKYLTVTGLSDSTLDGVYRIASVEASDIVVLDILHGVHETGLPDGDSFDWRLWEGRSAYYPTLNDWAVVRSAYSHTPAEPSFDIKLVSDYGYLPSVGIGPFGTWDNSAHAWSDDRNTTQKGPNSYLANDHSFQVFAYADTNHAIICMWSQNYSVSSSARFYPCFMYLGEITVPSTTDDPNPGVVVNGGMNYFPRSYWEENVVGADAGHAIYNSALWLSKLPANNTVVQGYLQIPDVRVGGTWNSLKQKQSLMYSQARHLPRIEVGLDCRVSGHMEYRGLMQNVWTSLQGLPLNTAFGVNREYLHLLGGLSIPWNGSHSHVFI